METWKRKEAIEVRIHGIEEARDERSKHESEGGRELGGRQEGRERVRRREREKS